MGDASWILIFAVIAIIVVLAGGSDFD